MKYFIDTEFIEGFHKPLFGNRRHFIDLISIGIVAEDGREFYAVSNEFNWKDADEWVRKNVIAKIPIRLGKKESLISWQKRPKPGASYEGEWIDAKSNKEITAGLLEFFGCWRDQHFWRVGKDIPEVYGYYSDYDWVLFCSLFGRMIDLPKGFPMYCIDLKQMLDENAAQIDQLEITKHIYASVDNGKWNMTGELSKNVFDASKLTFETKLALLKNRPDYPKQTDEHNALADAKWNYELYKFLNQ